MKTYECPIIEIDKLEFDCVICTSTSAFGDNDLFADELDGYGDNDIGAGALG